MLFIRQNSEIPHTCRVVYCTTSLLCQGDQGRFVKERYQRMKEKDDKQDRIPHPESLAHTPQLENGIVSSLQPVPGPLF